MNALRGHSNIQGLTDLGLMSNLIPGYLTLANDREPDYATYMRTRQFKPLRPNQTSFWQNYSKFFVSFAKSMYGNAATKDNDWAYDWLPKLDVTYDVLRAFELMHQGKMNGYFCQGFNPLLSFPNKKQAEGGDGQAEVPGGHGPARRRKTARLLGGPRRVQRPPSPTKIKTEVFELPTTCFAEDEGSLTNSSRWLQWHWPRRHASRRGQDRRLTSWRQIHLRHEGAIYKKDGRRVRRPDPEPPPGRMQGSGQRSASRRGDRQGDQRLRPGGRARSCRSDQAGAAGRASSCRLSRCIARRRQDRVPAAGSTTGMLQRGRQQHGPPRHQSDPDDTGAYFSKWAFSWPVPTGASSTTAPRPMPEGKAVEPKRKQYIDLERLRALGRLRRAGLSAPTCQARRRCMPFIMNPEGDGAAVHAGMMPDGPFPEHYEPFESPIAQPARIAKITGAIRSASACSRATWRCSATPRSSRIAATDLPSHRALPLLVQARAGQCRAPAGDVRGDLRAAGQGEGHLRRATGCEVSIQARRSRPRRSVTKRIKPLIVRRQAVHIVGIPIHWGFIGRRRRASGLQHADALRR